MSNATQNTEAWKLEAQAAYSRALADYRKGTSRIQTDPKGLYEESLARIISRVERVGSRCLETVECARCGERCVTVDNLALGILTRCSFAPWATISGRRAIEADDGLWLCNECVAEDEEAHAVEWAERWEDGAL